MDLNPVELPRNFVLRHRWLMKEMIGYGGYGAVYRALDLESLEPVAVKLEDRTKGYAEVLKVEQKILTVMAGEPHYCDLLASGAEADFNFLVMTLCGPSLHDLRIDAPYYCLSVTTVAQVTIQTVTALEMLHEAGYLHRDMKPANLCIGLEDTQRTVYIVDFGLARSYLKVGGDGRFTNQVRTARSWCGFRGTPRYASIRTHDNKETCRVDDLWPVFYMIMEMLYGELPWSGLRDMYDIARSKRTYDPMVFCQGLPGAFTQFTRHLTTLGYEDRPNYAALRRYMETVLRQEGTSMDSPPDWEENYRRCKWPPRYVLPGLLTVLDDSNSTTSESYMDTD